MTVHVRAQLDEEADEVRSMFADLTRSRSHRERLHAQIGYTRIARTHFTKVPPLLLQLRYANPTSELGGRAGSSFESRPAASLEALDTLTRIDLEAARWVRDLGQDDPGTTIEVVSKLGGLLTSVTRCRRRRARVEAGTRKVSCCTWHAVAGDVRKWWTQARVVTGWDAPAWRPNTTCPNCGVRRALRIRLEDRVGFCVECHETWPSDSYQVLAEHVRSESEAVADRVARGPCLCVWPRPLGVELQVKVRPLAMICPSCGSASCRHAVRSTGRK